MGLEKEGGRSVQQIIKKRLPGGKVIQGTGSQPHSITTWKVCGMEGWKDGRGLERWCNCISTPSCCCKPMSPNDIFMQSCWGVGWEEERSGTPTVIPSHLTSCGLQCFNLHHNQLIISLCRSWHCPQTTASLLICQLFFHQGTRWSWDFIFPVASVHVKKEITATHFVLGFGAEVFRFLPATCRQVQDGSGGHVSSLSIVGVVIGRALSVTVESEAGWRWLGKWGLTCRRRNVNLWFEHKSWETIKVDQSPAGYIALHD